MLIQRYFRFFGSSHKVELISNYYQKRHIQEFQAYYNKVEQDPLKGSLNASGSIDYLSRQSKHLSQENFNGLYVNQDLKVSCLGIGTYKGDSQDNIQIFNAIIDSVQSGGINHVDTALNFRFMQSERVVGAALSFLTQNAQYKRNELFLTTKHGYIPDDFDNKITQKQLIESIVIDIELIQERHVKQEEIIQNYCLDKNFLLYSLEMSLKNMNLEKIDLVYIQNPEKLLETYSEHQVYSKLTNLFEFYEKQRLNQKINYYGISSWNCFRINTLSIDKLIEIAQKVGGQNHGFRFIQSPFNVMMTELLFNQHLITLENKIHLITSSPLLQGTLCNIPLPSNVFECSYMGAKHLQFIRSCRLPGFLSSVIGMKSNRHVKQNLELIQYNKTSLDDVMQFLNSVKIRKQMPETPVEMD